MVLTKNWEATLTATYDNIEVLIWGLRPSNMKQTYIMEAQGCHL